MPLPVRSYRGKLRRYGMCRAGGAERFSVCGRFRRACSAFAGKEPAFRMEQMW